MRHAIPLVLMIQGCSLLTPGLDTRQAAEQRKQTVYDSEKNLSIDEATTQNNRTVMVESEKGGATIEFSRDGTPLKITGATTVLTQCSEPRDVMQTYMRLAEQNARVAEQMFAAIQSLVPVITTRSNQATRPE